MQVKSLETIWKTWLWANSIGNSKHKLDEVIVNEMYKILQSSVILRLKIDSQIFLLLIKPRRRLRSSILVFLEKYGWTEQKKERLRNTRCLKWDCKNVDMKKKTVIPVAVGALGASTGFEKYVVAVGIVIKAEHAQKQPYWGQEEFWDWYVDAKTQKTKTAS